MLRALGHDGIETYHMNEGHSALLTVALLREGGGDGGSASPSQADIAAVRSRCVFTTHRGSNTTEAVARINRMTIDILLDVLGLEEAQGFHPNRVA